MTNPYDAIIIGAGHNGLVCAAYLARAGLKTLVLERREVLGGAAVTEPLFPGYRVSTAAYLVSLLEPKIIEELELGRHGLVIDPKDPPYFALQPNGRHFFMWRDMARTQAEIARLSPRDAERYPAYEQMLDRMADIVRPLLLQAPPNVPARTREDRAALNALSRRMAELSPSDLRTFTQIMTGSAADLLDDWFESEELKVALATDGVIGVNLGPRSRGSAYVLLHHQMGSVDGSRGLWGFARGGTGSVSAAIASAARAAGAEIRTEAVVAGVDVRAGRTCGVVLENGEEIRARIVVSNADPKRTFLGLVGASNLSAEFAGQVERYRCEGVSFKINLALGELPNYSAVPGMTLGPQHRGTTHVAPSIDYLERAFEDAKRGNTSDRPMLEIGIPTAYDASLAPPGKHVMSIFCQYAPYSLAETTWEYEKPRFVDRVIDTLAEHAPNIRGAIEGVFAMSPVDIEQRFGMTGGHIFHGDLSPEQLFCFRPFAGWARYATPIRGLYLCGSGTHPGGGVMGASGHNAAAAVIGQLRRG
jgi:phytoene dehydrogenase-like protein